jgi:dihydroorotate dehydrogenase (fumarate)/dihydroorotate dehydrogenase
VIRELVVAVTPFIGIADYLTLNLHCPNIPAGHAAAFDDPDKLALLLKNLGDRHRELPPVFLKFTPSDPQDDEEVDRILDAVAPYGFVKGFILNIPARQPYDLKTPTKILETTRGGLTGPLLLKPTQDAIGRWFSRIDRRRHILIGVGGISSAEDVYETIRRGASLVQLYTAIVYQGPGLVKKLNVGLSRLLERDGFRNIGEAVGAEHRETSPQLSVRRNTA